MKQGAALLSEFMECWKNYLLFSKWLTKIFVYLDRYYIKFSNSDTTYQIELKSFRTIVYEKIKNNLVDAVLDEI